MATAWTIAIDWDRDGEFSGDDIVTERAVWVNWFLGFREPYKDIAQNSVLGSGPGQPRPALLAGERGRGESAHAITWQTLKSLQEMLFFTMNGVLED